jgi:hypothetical protein
LLNPPQKMHARHSISKIFKFKEKGKKAKKVEREKKIEGKKIEK